jgi:hypothetical protein
MLQHFRQSKYQPVLVANTLGLGKLQSSVSLLTAMPTNGLKKTCKDLPTNPFALTPPAIALRNSF